MTRKSEKRRKGSGIQTLLTRQEKLKYRLILEGIAVGLLAGLVSSAFRWTLMEAESIRTLFVESARQKLTLAVLGIFLLGSLYCRPAKARAFDLRKRDSAGRRRIAWKDQRQLAGGIARQIFGSCLRHRRRFVTGTGGPEHSAWRYGRQRLFASE